MKRSCLILMVLLWGVKPIFAQQHQFGERLNKKDYDKLHRFRAKNPLRQPTSVDLKKYCPTPVDQIGAICFAYASAYYGRTILYNLTVNETADPNKHVFSYGFMALLAKNSGGLAKNCKGGSSVALACEEMSKVGAVKLATLPDACPPKRPLTASMATEAAQYKVVAEKLYDQCTSSAAKIAAIKAALSEQTPVLFGLDVPRSFSAPNSAANPTLWTLAASDKRDLQCNRSVHAMCIIGYDDERFGGTFEIVNSWGTGWKNKGFTYIGYEDLALIARYAVRIRNVDPIVSLNKSKH